MEKSLKDKCIIRYYNMVEALMKGDMEFSNAKHKIKLDLYMLKKFFDEGDLKETEVNEVVEVIDKYETKILQLEDVYNALVEKGIDRTELAITPEDITHRKNGSHNEND